MLPKSLSAASRRGSAPERPRVAQNELNAAQNSGEMATRTITSPARGEGLARLRALILIMVALEADLAAAQAVSPDEVGSQPSPPAEAQAPPPDGATGDLDAQAKALAAADSPWRPALSGCGGAGLAVALGVGAGLAPVVGAPVLGGLACGALGCATTAWGWDLDPRPLPEGACVALDEPSCAKLGEAYGDAVLRRRRRWVYVGGVVGGAVSLGVSLGVVALVGDRL